MWGSIWTLMGSGYPLSGHNWVDIEEHENCKVTVSECEICGKIDISWTKKQ